VISPLHPSPPGVPAAIHREIYHVIAIRHVVEIEIDGHVRIGEPHDYGLLNGKPTLLFYQTSGYSKSGGLPQWRNLPVTRVTRVQALGETFRGGRAIEAGHHRQWDVLFMRADAS
jgi:hypothetical protein